MLRFEHEEYSWEFARDQVKNMIYGVVSTFTLGRMSCRLIKHVQFRKDGEVFARLLPGSYGPVVKFLKSPIYGNDDGLIYFTIVYITIFSYIPSS
jgi:hypothetical protein